MRTIAATEAMPVVLMVANLLGGTALLNVKLVILITATIEQLLVAHTDANHIFQIVLQNVKLVKAVTIQPNVQDTKRHHASME